MITFFYGDLISIIWLTFQPPPPALKLTQLPRKTKIKNLLYP